MRDLYAEKDLQLLSAQLKKRYLLLGCGLAALLAVVVYSFIIRLEPLTVVSLFLLCALAVFVIELFCLPIHRYRTLVSAALTGRTHEDTMEYVGAEPDTSLVDGVPCQGLLFLGEPDKHGTREQRYYWDTTLPLPDFRPGDRITLKYTGRNIIGYQAYSA